MSWNLRVWYFSLQIQSGANTPVKKILLNIGMTLKTAEVKQGITRNDSILDRIIFKKVQVSSYKCK